MLNFKPAPSIYVVQVMLRYGHFSAEPARSAFVFWLLSFADLDSYPGRAALEAAFSPTGTLDARCSQAYALANAGYLGKREYRYAIQNAKESMKVQARHG